MDREKEKGAFKVQYTKLKQANRCSPAAIKLQSILQRHLSAICTFCIWDAKVVGMGNDYI